MTNDCKECVMGCCGCISILALVAGGIAYYVFAIIALVNEYNEHFDKLCSCKSHLWIYMLVIIIYNLEFGHRLTDIMKDTKAGYVEKCVAYSITGLIELGLISWGWWELHMSGAHGGLHHLMLYKLAEVMVYFHTAFIGCIVIAFILTVIYSTDICDDCCGSSTKTPTPRPAISSIGSVDTVVIDVADADADAHTDEYTRTSYVTTSSPKPAVSKSVSQKTSNEPA